MFKNTESEKIVNRIIDDFLYDRKTSFNDLSEVDKLEITAALIKATPSHSMANFMTEHKDSDVAIELFATAMGDCFRPYDFFEKLKENAIDYYRDTIDLLLTGRNYPNERLRA